jgi:hypothetical protein
MINDIEDVWRELAAIRDRVEDEELASRLQSVLNYLYFVEERL